MPVQIFVFIILLLPLLWVMLRGKDAWPFSHYPMFSKLTNISEVEVFRVALETTAGEVVWWTSEFYRYPEFVGLWLKRIQQLEEAGGRRAALAQMERQRCLVEVSRLIETEGGHLDQYLAFLIVRRTAADGNGITIRDQTVCRIPLAGIKRISRAV